MAKCQNCGNEMRWIEQYGQWYCDTCRQYPSSSPDVGSSTPPSADPIWYQDFYSIRKKVLTLWNKYWIEDRSGRILGFSKQKMFKLKEDIRIYSDESMSRELFNIRQTQILDIWGTFAVKDTTTGADLGFIKRKALMSSFAWDEWDVLDANNRPVGGIHEDKGTGLVRKYVPFGALVPEKMTLKLNGVPVAQINQKFKIIGDIWELQCLNLPQNFDRRVLLGGLLLMGMIERSRK